MKIAVLFDEKAISRDFKTGFGLSLLINDSVLFDTGADGDILCHNIDRLKINTKKITTVVVSHEHWDHTGGLTELLSIINNPNIFVCRNFSRGLKKTLQESGGKIHMAEGFTKIAKNIYTTGEIYSTYKNMPIYEQSLVVITPQNHAALICGCCHYDLVKSIDKNKKTIGSYFGNTLTLDCILG
jgi:7,8-dihydropterin-6-yl-methyl-4-(beta-D-ribofuranosyl)aminobenzene 5'-phosphate synthase